MSRDSITYYLPFMSVKYSGDPKPLYLWLYHTFPSYIASWKMWLNIFTAYCKEEGIAFTIMSPEIVSDTIPQVLQYLINEGRSKQND